MIKTRIAPAAVAATLMTALATWAGAPLVAAPAQAVAGARQTSFDGVVEAVRQTVIAAQVSGAVVQLDVKAGDRVAAGQLLLRIDARAANQSTAASDAQVQAGRAALEVARRDFERQQKLQQQNFISQAALERAEAEFKSAQAQVNAQLAQAGATRTQGGFYVVRAPFAGVVAEVPVSLGDMALPGRPLLTLYDPAALRITAAVPLSVATRLAAGASLRGELPGLPAASQWVTPLRTQWSPTADAATHTMQLRADLPKDVPGAAPGMFARLWLPVSDSDTTGTATAAVSVPRQAVVRRAEMTGLYVLAANGQPVLRQVRLGRADGDRVEILSGLMAGERVVSDPAAAARAR